MALHGVLTNDMFNSSGGIVNPSLRCQQFSISGLHLTLVLYLPLGLRMCETHNSSFHKLLIIANNSLDELLCFIHRNGLLLEPNNPQIADAFARTISGRDGAVFRKS